MTFGFTTPIKSKAVASSYTHGFITPPTVIIDNSYDNEYNDITITILKEKRNKKTIQVVMYF
jgi:hypothetical protein